MCRTRLPPLTAWQARAAAGALRRGCSRLPPAERLQQPHARQPMAPQAAAPAAAPAAQAGGPLVWQMDYASPHQPAAGMAQAGEVAAAAAAAAAAEEQRQPQPLAPGVRFQACGTGLADKADCRRWFACIQ